MSEPWRDINDPGAFWKPEPEGPKKPIGMDDSSAAEKEPLAKEYRFKDVSIIEPAQGFEKNKPFDIEGEIELLGDKLTASKILLYPIGLYNNQEDKFVPGGIEADLDTDTNKFCGTCDHLFDPDAYVNDSEKTSDATWKLFVRAEGKTAEKPMESEQLTFPKPSKFVELNKDHYDEDGASKYNKPQSGDNFKPDGVVKALQGDLIKIGLLPKDSDDGFFGGQTDKAVRKFQDFAIKSERMKRSTGKVETTDKPLDQQQPDGIVGMKTRDELDRWLQNDWIKPIPTLRHGEYDDTGVSNGKGKSGTDDHHEGTLVVDVQKNLQKVGVYSDGAVDGWFYDKMQCSVKDFQSAAADATFVVDGNLTTFDQKLTGYQKGEMCAATQEYLKMVVEKGGVVPKNNELDLPAKQKIVNLIASFEGGASKYTAANKDYEFEGRWDLPRGWYKDKSKAKPDSISTTVTYSKYSNAPRHIGLSFGLIQFTQESSLGALVKKMADKDLDSFKTVFGENYQKLLDTLSKNGDFQTHQETIYDNCGNNLGTKNVKRKPSVQPVAGHEVWSDYWVSKFKASGGIDAFQKCQEELAISAYFDPIISAAKGKKVSQKSLCLLYDRSVNQGSGYAKKLVGQLNEAGNEQDFWKDYSQKQKDDIKNRVDKILANTDMKWEVQYDL